MRKERKQRGLGAMLGASAFLLLSPATQGWCEVTAQRVSKVAAPSFHFDFAPSKQGVTITSDAPYDAPRGYGFEAGAQLTSGANGMSSDAPFSFSVAIPPGNYKVEVGLGGATGGSVNTVKVEARRLMLHSIRVAEGKSQLCSFTIAVKSPLLANGDRVRLKPEERDHRDWDDRLTLEFLGTRPVLRSLNIRRVEDAPTLFLAGDSTVTNQKAEPYAAWGQMLPCFFGPNVAISNEAESGETLRAFVGERRLARIEQNIKAGDYLFIQFAHNDQKAGTSHVEPFTTYQDELMRFVKVAKDHGATPVLVTSMPRRRFDAQGHIVNTLDEYPAAMRQLAQREGIVLIDLNTSAQKVFEALGPDGTLHAFVHYPAHTFPGQTTSLKDDTHFNNYGAYELARAVIESIRTGPLPLKALLRDDVTPFDPAHPDDVNTFDLPPSPPVASQKPEGN